MQRSTVKLPAVSYDIRISDVGAHAHAGHHHYLHARAVNALRGGIYSAPLRCAVFQIIELNYSRKWAVVVAPTNSQSYNKNNPALSVPRLTCLRLAASNLRYGHDFLNLIS